MINKSQLIQTLVLIFCVSLSWGPSRVWALPAGAEVVLGTAEITTDGDAMTVRQGGDRLAIDWTSFGVGSAESLVFVQPGANSVALNRVLGSGPSEILGRLSANGQVFIVNPQGVLFGRDAEVDVGGLVASSLSLSVEDFSAGRYTFGSSGPSALGDVRNDGLITSADRGYVALIGSRVENQGTIVSHGGAIALGAGNLIRLELADGSLLGFVIEEDVLGALVEHGGHLLADGGLVLLGARGQDALLDTVINVDGIVRARSIGEENGEIIIGGGPQGRVSVTGHIDASGTGSGELGGRIEVTGEQIAVGGTTVIDARGSFGGGEVLIGGDYQGANPTIQNAKTLVVDAGAQIDASATLAGDGGRVILWSDEQTRFAGHLAARGGSEGGDGGFAEVSGKVNLTYAGIADLRAPAGRAGSLLLDPKNFSIKQSGGDMTTEAIAAQLELGDLTIMTSAEGDGDGNIIIWDPLTVEHNNLTLLAHRNINLEAPITLIGEVNLTLRADSQGTGVGTIVVGDDDPTVTAPDGNVYAYYNTRNYELAQDLPWVVPVDGRQNAHAFYLVNTLEDLQAIGESSATQSRSYALGRDIDADSTAEWNDGKGFVPIEQLSGIFDGLGHVIDGLTINRTDTDVGLFQEVSGEVRNLGLTRVNITGKTAGALAGGNNGTIYNVYVSGGQVTGNKEVGGLVGNNRSDGTISHSYADVSVTRRMDVSGAAGGLVGANYGAIALSYALGAVDGGESPSAGGLVGVQTSTGTIEYSYATGKIDGGQVRGGLVARNQGKISSSYWDMETTGVNLGVGSNLGGNLSEVVGLTSLQMRSKFEMENFDFDNDWYIINFETRPFLRSEYSTTIRNAHQLQMMELDITADYVLGRDIDLSELTRPEAHWNPEKGFYPIGWSNGIFPFTGSLDGQHHVINGLRISRMSASGLFGYFGGTVRRVGLIDPEVEALESPTGYGNIGGTLIAMMEGGEVSESYSVGGHVVGTNNATLGGLVALMVGAKIENSYSTTDVSGSASTAGGLVGEMRVQSAIVNAYSAGSVDVFCEGECDIGGLVGKITSNAEVENSFWDKDASGQSQSAGGTGLSTADMQKRSTFRDAGWNFSGIWTIDGGYPYFGEALSKIISGVLAGIDSAEKIAKLRIVISGTLLDETVETDANGNYVFELEPDAWEEGDVLVIFVEAGSGDPGNAVILSDGNSHEGVDIERNTVSWRAYIESAGSNTEMLKGIGDLDHDRILYSGTASADGTDIVFDEKVEGIFFYGHDRFVLDGNLTAKDGNIWFGDLLLVAREEAAVVTNGLGGTGGTLLFEEIQSEGDGDRSLRVDSGTGDILFNSGVDLKGLYITSAGRVFQSQDPGKGMNLQELLLLGDGGTFELTNDNTIMTVAGDTGSVLLSHVGAGTPLEVGTVKGNKGLHVTETLALLSDSGITLEESVSASGMGNAIVLSTGGYLSIEESAGGNAISTPNGRYLVYALDPDGMMFGQFESPGNLFNRTFAEDGPGTIDATFGSRFVYANQPTLTVNAKDESREYGEENPALIFDVDGLVDGDTVQTALTGWLSTDATLTSDVGSYVIGQGTLAELLGYALTFNEGTLTITKAPLNVKAVDVSRQYGTANPTFVVVGDGFKLGENEDVLTGAANTDAHTFSNVGTYEITRGTIDAENYVITFVPGTLNVTKAPLTVRAVDATRTYGEENPVFNATFDGLLGTDTEETAVSGALSSSATVSSNVGSYAITRGTLDANNYEITFVDGNLEITKRPLLIWVNPVEREYGDANPGFVLEGEGFVLGEGIDVLIGEVATMADVTSPVGVYAVTQGSLDAQNYAITFDEGELRIVQAPLVIRVNDATREYGEANPAFTVTTSDGNGGPGFKLGEDMSALSGVLQFDTVDHTASVLPDGYVISVSGVSSGNYAITFVDGRLYVAPALLTITANDAERPAGAANPEFSVTYSGFKLGEDESVLIGEILLATEATPASRPGEYAIVPAGLEAANYVIEFVDGTLRILPLPQDHVVEPSQVGSAERVRGSTGGGNVQGDDVDELHLTDIDVGRDELNIDLELRLGNDGDVEIAAQTESGSSDQGGEADEEDSQDGDDNHD